jgi:uncharacterized protein YdeI (YjbR/CyaY-like superfamily)
MDLPEMLEFGSSGQLEEWLSAHHGSKRELWVRIFKKGSGTLSVTWDDCVVAALSWGWIDGQRRAHDDVSFLQRLTPRRPRSSWSKRNREHAERLIAEGRMQPPGLLHVQSAREDGRWDQAYAGSAEMVVPEDFLMELRKNTAAERFYATLNRRNLFAIYHRIHTAKRAETRAKRIAAIVAQLARGEALYS